MATKRRNKDCITFIFLFFKNSLKISTGIMMKVPPALAQITLELCLDRNRTRNNQRPINQSINVFILFLLF